MTRERPWRARANQKALEIAAQVLRYSVSGVLALIVHTSVFYLLAYSMFPAIEGMVVDGRQITDGVRARNAIISNGVAFFFGNAVAYYASAIWVFVRGRHHPLKEFLLFSGISLLSFLLTILFVPLVISGFGLSTHVAQATFTTLSAGGNFVLRKFLVFKH